MSITRFNLRVYALITNEFEEILLSDEYRFGTFFTKFPGGGVEIGEGISEALKRELLEEMGIEISEMQFYYFNDFFQESAFSRNHQIVSFYYRIQIKKTTFGASEYVFPFEEEGEKQRWTSIKSLSLEELTFPVDKLVFDKLKKEFH